MLACWLVFTTSVWAQSSGRSYANAFLEIPLGGRASGLGNAYAAVANDGTAFFWNPAGVSLMHRREISMMYATQFEGFGQYNFLGYTHQLSERYGFSVSWIRYSVGSIDEFLQLEDSYYDRGHIDYDFSKYYSGQFSYADNALFFSFAKLNTLRLNLGWLYSEFPIEIPLGINFKVIQGGSSGIKGNGIVNKDVSKFGIGVDVGTMIMFGMNDLMETPYLGDFVLAFNVQDATGTAVRWNAISSETRAQDVVQPNLKFGMAYAQPLDELESNLLFSYEHNSRYGGDHHFGVEYDYKRLLALRLGTDNGTLTYGVGVSAWQFRLDYALSNQALGSVHRISAAYRF
jgi:hypothetical protein